jgi:hypothetical protein
MAEEVALAPVTPSADAQTNAGAYGCNSHHVDVGALLLRTHARGGGRSMRNTIARATLSHDAHARTGGSSTRAAASALLQMLHQDFAHLLQIRSLQGC